MRESPSRKQAGKVLSLEKELRKKDVRERLARTRAHLEEIADLGACLVREVGETVEEELERQLAEIERGEEPPMRITPRRRRRARRPAKPTGG